MKPIGAIDAVNRIGPLHSRVGAIVLLFVGLSQIAADLLHLSGLKAVAAATMCSPCPKVFTAHGDYETFSTRFFIEWNDLAKAKHVLEVTPSTYRRIQGAYARRKIFEAVIVYWPIVERTPHLIPMFSAVCRYALSGEAPLLRELGVDPDSVLGAVKVRFLRVWKEQVRSDDSLDAGRLK